MSKKLTRRSFLQAASAAGVGLPIILASSADAAAPSERIRHAAVGCGGMGGADLQSIASSPYVDIVALCDIDDNHIAAARQGGKRYEKAETYNDFRRMFDKLEGKIDSCHVTVPDHMHAPISMAALDRGIHVYCQKPLTHEIVEARRLREMAAEKNLVTQMGIQIHSHPAYRTCVKLIQDGAIGAVTEVHTWCDRGWTNNGRPSPQTPPANVHWDLWLGVAPERPYGPGAYHPQRWWSWIDFGTGNLGDMGCHLLDPVSGSLQLTAPTRVTADCDPPRNETWPSHGKVVYEFPETKYTAGPISLTWYDGGFGRGYHPPIDLLPLKEGDRLPNQGSIFLGEKGSLLLPHWSTPKLYPQEAFADFEYPDVGQLNHWHTFVNACRGEGSTTAGFDYAGPLTETVLLGNLAKRFPGQSLEWNAEQLKVTNFDEANNYTMRPYRKGWEDSRLSV